MNVHAFVEGFARQLETEPSNEAPVETTSRVQLRSVPFVGSALLAGLSAVLLFVAITMLLSVWVAVLLAGVFVGWLAYVRHSFEDARAQVRPQLVPRDERVAS